MTLLTETAYHQPLLVELCRKRTANFCEKYIRGHERDSDAFQQIFEPKD